MLNNQSLETLLLDCARVEGSSNGPPVDLPNIKSFSVYSILEAFQFSTIFRVPALRRLSSLLISIVEEGGNYFWFAFRATGDEIVFTVKCFPGSIEKVWQDLTGYARPSIKHVRLENPKDHPLGNNASIAVATLFADVHTLEIAHGCAPSSYPEF